MVSLNFLVNILRLRSICFTSWTTSCFTGDFAVPVLGIPGFRRSGRSGVSRGRSFDRYAARRRVAGGGHAVVDIACAATCNYNKNVTRNRRNSSQIKCEKVEINLSTKASHNCKLDLLGPNIILDYMDETYINICTLLFYTISTVLAVFDLSKYVK